MRLLLENVPKKVYLLTLLWKLNNVNKDIYISWEVVSEICSGWDNSRSSHVELSEFKGWYMGHHCDCFVFYVFILELLSLPNGQARHEHYGISFWWDFGIENTKHKARDCNLYQVSFERIKCKFIVWRSRFYRTCNMIF